MRWCGGIPLHTRIVDIDDDWLASHSPQAAPQTGSVDKQLHSVKASEGVLHALVLVLLSLALATMQYQHYKDHSGMHWLYCVCY